jgi:tRNA pseudouridine38-40 synthase
MFRYRLIVEYDGTGLVGWQRQPCGPSVQQILEEAVFGFCQQRLEVTAAGRTDAGVHALAQVVHLDLPKEYGTDTVRDALNFHMRGKPVVVIEAQVAAPDFHARFSAVGRKYLYRILNRRAQPALDRTRVWWVAPHLDVDAMAAGAALLLGKHDFSSFRASECQAQSPIKTLDVLNVTRHGDEIHIRAEARSFLHHQVRNMVGTLKLVGDGKWQPDDVAIALEAKDRKRAGPTSPASGLYLTQVVY